MGPRPLLQKVSKLGRSGPRLLQLRAGRPLSVGLRCSPPLLPSLWSPGEGRGAVPRELAPHHRGHYLSLQTYRPAGVAANWPLLRRGFLQTPNFCPARAKAILQPLCWRCFVFACSLAYYDCRMQEKQFFIS
ncbi:unnamed protein product, partial [Amoebophrya sp. A120]|eukprot:GSA120T00018211001.1